MSQPLTRILPVSVFSGGEEKRTRYWATKSGIQQVILTWMPAAGTPESRVTVPRKSTSTNLTPLQTTSSKWAVSMDRKYSKEAIPRAARTRVVRFPCCVISIETRSHSLNSYWAFSKLLSLIVFIFPVSSQQSSRKPHCGQCQLNKSLYHVGTSPRRTSAGSYPVLYTRSHAQAA